jgi:N-acyl-D-aspartate/D-glutamate deacylase
MLKQYDDLPPAALARGPAKASDIERVRREMVNAQYVARNLAGVATRGVGSLTDRRRPGAAVDVNPGSLIRHAGDGAMMSG